MRRRAAFLVAIGFGAVVAGAPLPVLAQQPGKVLQIGVLSPATAENAPPAGTRCDNPVSFVAALTIELTAFGT